VTPGAAERRGSPSGGRRPGSRAQAFTIATRHEAAVDLWPADDRNSRDLLRARQGQHSADSTTGWDVITEARDGLLALGDGEGAAEAEALLGDILWREGQQERAFGRLEAAVALLSHAPPSAAKAHVVQELSRLLMLAGRNAEAIRLGGEALAMARTLELDVIEAQTLNNIGTARVASGDVGGLADLERSAELAEAANAAGALSRARINGGRYTHRSRAGKVARAPG
jgi:ATP/maltotriose-dependent transcriptional regulator MalT